jgi:hypothetical protein
VRVRSCHSEPSGRRRAWDDVVGRGVVAYTVREANRGVGESSACYHAYVLAEMAVHQTRAHFLKTDGFLTDNPSIGPAIERACWNRGNRLTHDETLVALTGQPLSADALVEVSNRTVDEALAEAKASWEAVATRPAFTGPVELDATIRLVHGHEVIANTESSTFDEAATAFSKWVRGLEGAARA